MSFYLDAKHRRGRKGFVDAMKRRLNPAADTLQHTHDDLPLLRQIAPAPNGWHPDALDRFKRAQLIEDGLLELRANRLRLTRKAKELVSRNP